ncbi:lycopene cyclase domain-containing protein [Pseudarthrobacter sp. NKDBFgelt]|uniref:lycopene cyclase domain-containing protein n=1 Tax=Pseudarthrobacter sp. NKDBFgelt TaxID=3384443 RepID=UPI0038D3AA4D
MYWALNAVFLTVALGVATAALHVVSAGQRKIMLAAAGGTAAVVLVLTAVFDNLMIAAGLFSYASELISGAAVGLAPLEDFAYPVAAVLLLPSLWVVLGERSRKRRT